MKNINIKNILFYVGLLLAGLLLGWLFFGGESEKVDQREKVALDHDHEGETTWTCSMHPQIRQEEPGQCPICGMDLIPLEGDAEVVADTEIQMTEAAMKIADVMTVTVQEQEPFKEIYLPGKVQADERRMSEITARFNGRIENLFINFTGQQVYKGQKLATIYSPELVTAQKELFEALKFRDTNPSFYQSAINKLKLWDLTDAQIEEIIDSGELKYQFDVLAPTSGTVTTRNVTVGDYVKEGESLFQIANLSKVWVMFDAYESDLPWISEGDEIQFAVQSLPKQAFTSKVTFIDPVLNPNTRTASIRTEVANTDDKLKPAMLARGIIKSSLPGLDEALLIPKSAVLWTGKRAIVYVKQPYATQPTFEYREILLGPEAGGQYVVSGGLNAGEEVVANGVFKVDAAAQLQGKVSMMNPPDQDDVTEGQPEQQINAPVQTLAETFNDIDEKFKAQLANLLKAYLELKNALVESETATAQTVAKEVLNSLAEVDMKLLQGDAHLVWMDHQREMQTALNRIVNQEDLPVQREAFSNLSNALYQSIKQFDVKGLNAYYQFCPMAFDDTGAYWISATEAIRNPYFGESMMSCGVTRETLE